MDRVKKEAARLARLSPARFEQIVGGLSGSMVLQLLAYCDQRLAQYRLIHALLTARVTQPHSEATPDPATLLTVPEVAAHLRVSKSRVYQLIRSERLPHVTIGQRQVRVRQADLKSYLDGHGKETEEQS